MQERFHVNYTNGVASLCDTMPLRIIETFTDRALAQAFCNTLNANYCKTLNILRDSIMENACKHK